MNTDRILRRGPAALAAVLAICLAAVGIFVAAPAAVAVEPPLRPQVIDLPAPPDLARLTPEQRAAVVTRLEVTRF